MVETSSDFADEHVVIDLDAGRPLSLDELQESFAAIASIYKRQNPSETPEAAPAKLYVSRISSGSPIHLEVAPLVALLGQPIAFMDSALIIREFARWMGLKLQSLAAGGPSIDLSSSEAKDLEAFIEPLAGRSGASLGITHAKFKRKETDGTAQREIIAEYKFTDGEINRAVVNARKLIDADERFESPRTETVREVLMAFQQADNSPGKERGRTGDRVIISTVTDKPLPVYFPREAAAIKRRILEQTDNPFSKGYIVDVVVSYVGDDKPKMYNVIELHHIVDLED